LGTRMTRAGGSRRTRFAWRALAGCVALGGVLSSIAISRADTWWIKSGYSREVDRIIGSESNPLILADPNENGVGRIMSLSYYLGEDIRYILSADPDSSVLSTSGRRFALDPSPALRRNLLIKGYQLNAIDASIGLWQVVESRRAIRRP